MRNSAIMTKTLNHHQLAIEMVTKIFMAYITVLKKYTEFCGTYMFEDFTSTLDTLSDARPTHYIINPATFERYVKAISCII